MTKPDFDDVAEGPSEGAVMLKRAVLGIGGGILLVFLASAIAGYGAVAMERGGPDLIAATVIAVMFAMAALVGYGIWRFWPHAPAEPVAPRVRSARNLLLIAVAFGFALGIMLGLSDGGPTAFVSNTPVSPGIAALAIALWAIVGPLLSWLWWRKIDEHEAGAYRDGAMVAAHAYFFIVPAWWMASRAGWLPPQEPMLVLLAVACLWLAVWFVRRYL